MPGVGWVVAALTLIVASILAPLTGRRWLAISLAISLVHLFTFGPLSGFRLPPGLPLDFAVLAIAVPFAVAAMVLWSAIIRNTGGDN